jgi:hypothetical protein
MQLLLKPLLAATVGVVACRCQGHTPKVSIAQSWHFLSFMVLAISCQGSLLCQLDAAITALASRQLLLDGIWGDCGVL